MHCHSAAACGMIRAKGANAQHVENVQTGREGVARFSGDYKKTGGGALCMCKKLSNLTALAT
jgi:predicted outer membrane repeat protein